MKNYYATLGIQREASAEEIKIAYRELARKYHPDLVGERGAPMFEEINEAYRFLSDPVKRIGLDMELSKTAQEAKPKVVEIEIASEAKCEEVLTANLPDGYAEELERQIGVYEEMILELSKSDVSSSRELQPLSVNALVRNNRIARERKKRLSTK